MLLLSIPSVLFTMIFLVNCTQDNSPISMTCPTDGEFIMDTYSFTATVQTHPDYDSLWCYLSYSFTYHYENVPGNWLSRVLQVKDYHWSRLFITPAGLESPNVTKKWEETQWLRDDMNGVDSLYIIVVFYGVLEAGTDCAEGFEWTQSTTIPIVRD